MEISTRLHLNSPVFVNNFALNLFFDLYFKIYVTLRKSSKTIVIKDLNDGKFSKDKLHKYEHL